MAPPGPVLLQLWLRSGKGRSRHMHTVGCASSAAHAVAVLALYRVAVPPEFLARAASVFSGSARRYSCSVGDVRVSVAQPADIILTPPTA